MADSRRNLFEVIVEHAENHGNMVASVDAIRDAHTESPLPKIISYAMLNTAARRLAGSMQVLLEPPHATHSAVICSSTLYTSTPLVTWMQRGNEWYVVYAAGMLLGRPLMSLSTDLSDAAAEQRRNDDVLQALDPLHIVVDEKGAARAAEKEVKAHLHKFMDLWLQGEAPSPMISSTESKRGEYETMLGQGGQQSALCFCYTGGTTKAAKCAIATHEMALSEIRNYPEVCGETAGPKSVVLQQHSVYWGASCYGEIDIALALGCKLVFAEASGPEELRGVLQAHEVTVAGLVPAVLSGLEPASVPSLQLVFTWGEKLSSRTALRWANADVRVVDLLISTECWLSFYADWQAWVRQKNGRSDDVTRPAFQTVRDAIVELKPTDVETKAQGAGELLLAGPMVFPGYLVDGLISRSAFSVQDSVVGAVAFYRTSDLAYPVEQNSRRKLFQYVGRCDDLIKVAGEWVDLSQMAAQLADVCCVSESSICDKQAFVAIDSEVPTLSGCVPELRRRLPPEFGLFCLVDALPRHPGTGKVDRTALQTLAGTTEAEMSKHDSGSRQVAAEELMEYIKWYLPLSFVAFGAFLHELMLDDAVVDPRSIGGHAFISVQRFVVLECPARFLALAYLRLAQLHAYESSSRVGQLFRVVADSRCVQWFLPWQDCGLLILLVTLPPVLCVMIFAAPGVYLASHRRRLLSWPAVALLGFGSWSRNSGVWWTGKGCSGVLCWYAQQLWACPRPAWKPLLLGVLQHLGLGRQCENCHAWCWPRQGAVDQKNHKWSCVACRKKYAPLSQSRSESWNCAACNTSNWESRSTCRKPNCEAFRGHMHSSADTQKQAKAHQRNAFEQTSQIVLDATQILGPADMLERLPAQVAKCIQPGSVITKSKEWLLVEEVIGCTIETELQTIPGLDSLRATKMRTAARRELGRILGRTDLLRCNTFQEILRALENAPCVETPAQFDTQHVDDPSEHSIWYMMWKSQCLWVVHRDRPLEEPVLRRALRGLIERHPALRTQEQDPGTLHREFQQTLSVLACVRSAANRFSIPGSGLPRILRGFAGCMKRAWPRVTTAPAPMEAMGVPLTVIHPESSLDGAKKALWRCRSFEPPFHVTLVHFGDELVSGCGGEALVQLQVSHMVSDGFSVVPLLSDLAHFVAVAEGRLPRPLPPLPNMLKLLEERLHRTIDNDMSRADTVSLEQLRNGVCAREHVRQRQAAKVLVEVPKIVVASLKTCASEVYGSSEEIIVLTALAVALARLHCQTVVSLSLVAPQRDEPRAGEMIGFLADTREVDVLVGRDLSYLGVAVAIADTVRGRRWRAPALDASRNAEKTYSVNFQWTDFASREGFTQLPEFHFAQLRDWINNPLEITVDEPAPSRWRIALNFDAARYGASQRRQFVHDLTNIFRDILRTPSGHVWPDSGRHAALDISRACDAVSVRRIIGACGWVVHGLAFELSDGRRVGVFLYDDGKLVELDDDVALQQRGGLWHDLQEGETIAQVSGKHSNFGYIAGEVKITTSLGRDIVFSGSKEAKKSEPFAFAASGNQHMVVDIEVSALVGSRRYCHCQGLMAVAERLAITT